MKSKIFKRTFEALKYPVNSKKRRELNEDGITSEYMPSYKWQLKSWRDDGSELASMSFRTKEEAETFIHLKKS